MLARCLHTRPLASESDAHCCQLTEQERLSAEPGGGGGRQGWDDTKPPLRGASDGHNARSAAVAATCTSALEEVASNAARLASEELPALRLLLVERVQTQQARAARVANQLTGEAEALQQAVARTSEDLDRALGLALQGAAERQDAAARVPEEAALTLRGEVDSASARLQEEVSELVERLRRTEQVRQRRLCAVWQNPYEPRWIRPVDLAFRPWIASCSFWLTVRSPVIQ